MDGCRVQDVSVQYFPGMAARYPRTRGTSPISQSSTLVPGTSGSFIPRSKIIIPQSAFRIPHLIYPADTFSQ